jgi:hypothetical protein
VILAEQAYNNPAAPVIWVICLGICIYLGSKKGRLGLGIALGIFCGLIGVVIMLLVPSKRSGY